MEDDCGYEIYPLDKSQGSLFFPSFRPVTIGIADIDANDYPDVLISFKNGKEYSSVIYMMGAEGVLYTLPLNDSTITSIIPFDLHENG